MATALKRSTVPSFVSVSVLAAATALGAASQAGPASAQAATITQSYFTAEQTPATALDTDRAGVELGMKFSVKTAGQVTSIRFFKGGTANSGSHVGSIWNSSGTRLARVTFSAETTSGWQQANLATPLPVTTGNTYVVSYHAPVGRYSATNNFFSSARTSGQIATPTNAGVYRYGTASAYPTSAYKASNYWVDVVLSTTTTTPTPTPTTTPTSVPPDGEAKGCVTRPSACGYPDSTNTGPAPGTILRAVPEALTSGPGWHYDTRGWIVMDGNGAVLEGIRTKVPVDVKASNVLIRNNDIQVAGESWGVALRTGAAITIDRNNIYSSTGTGAERMLVGIKDIYGTVSGVTVTRNNIWHASTGIQMDSGTITDNYVHDPGMKDGDHINGITSNGGTDLMVMRHNTILNPYGQTDAIGLFQDFGRQANRVIDDNLLAGGGYTVYAGANVGKETGAAYISVTNNRFSSLYFPRSGHWGPATAYYRGGNNSWTGNVYDATGAGVPTP